MHSMIIFLIQSIIILNCSFVDPKALSSQRIFKRNLKLNKPNISFSISYCCVKMFESGQRKTSHTLITIMQIGNTNITVFRTTCPPECFGNVLNCCLNKML